MSSVQCALVCRHLSSLRSNPPGSPAFISALSSIDEISPCLAKDAGTRKDIGGSSPDLWTELCMTWKSLSVRNVDMLIDESVQRSWTLCVARFTRNLVAGSPQNQREAFKFEPEIRAVAHVYTSHVFVTNREEFVTTRSLMQAISNLITANEDLLQRLWITYLSLSEEKNILIRGIAHPDDRTATVSFVLVANCIARNPERMQMLTSTPMGRRLCLVMLDRLSRHVETSDENEHSDLFDVGWNIFETLFNNKLAPALVSITTMEGEAVNPHQTTLLKLLDSYLIQSSTPLRLKEDAPVSQFEGDIVFAQISNVLLSKFFELMQYVQSSIKRSLGQSSAATDKGDSDNNVSTSASSAPPLQSLDVLLPRVCEATVLVAQCFCTLTLAQNNHGELSEQARRTQQLLIDSSPPNGESLRLLDAFLPRIMFGKASWSTARPDPGSSARIDKKEDRGFSYLKRDLIRLLGILCYENRPVQDRVRACNGITVVMNLCVMDERNPYLREHALFALRNLLHGNADNQAVVAEIKPVESWDENGIIRDVLGAER